MHAHCIGSRANKSSGSHSSHIARACVISLWVLFLISSTPPFTSSPSSSSLWSPCCSYCPTPSTSTIWWTNTLRTSPENLGTLAENEPRTGYEPNGHFITADDFDCDDVTIGKKLLDVCRRRADHSEEEGRSSCLSSSVSHDRTGNTVVCRLVSSAQETQRHTSESEQIRTLLEWQRERILADCQAEIRKHEFQADYDRKSIQKLNETIGSQKEEICRAHQGDERRRQDHQLRHEQLLKQNWDLREAHEKSLSEMEELKRFQGSTFETVARRKLIEDRDTILELTGNIQELQHEIKCMNDSRDFQDAESARSGQSHITSQPVSFPPHPVPGGMLSRSLGMQSRNNGPPSIWDTHWISGNVFANPAASSSAHYPQELNPWSSHFSLITGGQEWEPSTSSGLEMPVRTVSRKFIRSYEGKILKELWSRPTTTADFASSLWQIPHVSNVCLLEDKIQDWGMYWFTISYRSNVVDQRSVVEAVDDLKSSSSIRGISMPNFEVLDARIASALNKIIHNSHFKRRISLEEQKAQKQDRFLRVRQVAYLIYEYFRVTGANDSVENSADLFNYCSSKWWYSGILFEMGRNFIFFDENPIWWYLGRIVQNEEYESLRNTRPYWNCTTWRLIRRKLDLIITDWRQWWKEVSSKIYETGILGPETEMLRRTAWSRIRRQNSVYKEFLKIVGSGEPTGSVLKETIAVSVKIWISVQNRHSRILLRALLRGRMREMRWEPEIPEAEVPVGECFDCRARISSKELATIHSVKNGILQNACSTSRKMDADLGKSVLMRIARLKNSLARGPKRMVTKVQWLCWRFHDDWVAYFRIWSRRSLHRFYGRAQTHGNRSDV